jgi:hypothetical protein
MSRFFNTTGPCNPDDHYMLAPEQRLVYGQLSRYIESKLYWVLHAPRQTGKTTFLQSWMRELNLSGQAVACYVTVERCQQFPDAADAIPMICEAIIASSTTFLSPEMVPSMPTTSSGSMLDAILTDWAALVAPKPLVVLFDEVDVLQGQSMISFLRQLRGGFAIRGIGKFPVSIALVGMRDLRDYLVQSKDGVPLNPGSPFNIKEDSATLSNFSHDDVLALAGQHTTGTGQRFSPEALDLAYELTGGQPWLTNALLKKCVWDLCPDGQEVGTRHILEAKESLIQRRAVHLDSLAERLRDPRIRRVVQLILTGDSDPTLTEGDDFRLSLDMGLVVKGPSGPAIANPIYREVIARVLSQGMQDALPEPEFPWKRADGRLDMDALLKEFQKFWRRHADLWEAKADYTEAFPHLLLMAFLQRVVNGGGRVEREFAAGRGRMDLAVLYGGAWNIIEIKLVHPQDGRQLTVEEGLAQTMRYRDTIDKSAACYLVVFDRTPAGRALSWEERLTWTVAETPTGTVTVVGG